MARETPPAVRTRNCGAKLTLCRGKKAGGADGSDEVVARPCVVKRRDDSKSPALSSSIGVGEGNVYGPFEGCCAVKGILRDSATAAHCEGGDLRIVVPLGEIGIWHAGASALLRGDAHSGAGLRVLLRVMTGDGHVRSVSAVDARDILEDAKDKDDDADDDVLQLGDIPTEVY